MNHNPLVMGSSPSFPKKTLPEIPTNNKQSNAYTLQSNPIESNDIQYNAIKAMYNGQISYSQMRMLAG